jgi:hypothetical protein
MQADGANDNVTALSGIEALCAGSVTKTVTPFVSRIEWVTESPA